MPSLYARYIYEREGKSIVEDEHGFATFLFLPEHCYIEDIYVVPDKRKEGIASKYADEIARLAKQKGYSKLLGSVNTKAARPDVSLKTLLAYGFIPISADKDMIYLEKLI